MSGLVTDYMEAYGTKFSWRCTPKSVEKLSSGLLQVTWMDVKTKEEHKDTFNSVLWAVGEAILMRHKYRHNINLFIRHFS